MLHVAAESHVDRSIDELDVFITTNVRGTFVLIEAAALVAMPERRQARRFVQCRPTRFSPPSQKMTVSIEQAATPPNSSYAASNAAATRRTAPNRNIAHIFCVCLRD